MGLLCFLFFIGPWFALAAWVWNETGGLAASRHALLGTVASEPSRTAPVKAPDSEKPPASGI